MFQFATKSPAQLCWALDYFHLNNEVSLNSRNVELDWFGFFWLALFSDAVYTFFSNRPCELHWRSHCCLHLARCLLDDVRCFRREFCSPLHLLVGNMYSELHSTTMVSCVIVRVVRYKSNSKSLSLISPGVLYKVSDREASFQALTLLYAILTEKVPHSYFCG